MIIALLLSMITSVAHANKQTPTLVVLGIAQDAGHPQAGCKADHCQQAWSDPTRGHLVSSLGLTDPQSGQHWLLDATPDLPQQLHALSTASKTTSLAGVFLTHAHIGHYTGLVHLGREVMGANEIPVYAMPRMQNFLSTNGPWEQLVSLQNIKLNDCSESVALAKSLRVEALVVPHRDEYSETVGFRIQGPNHAALYLPDIDKWERWETPIEEVLRTVDIAYIDGTFFGDGELGNRDMSAIPHPFISETMRRLKDLPKKERAKVHFIHLNHTNPALINGSLERKDILKRGYNVANEGDTFEL